MGNFAEHGVQRKCILRPSEVTMFASRFLSLALVLPLTAVPAAVADGPRSTHESCVTTLGAERISL
jgi:hypothetical protein